MEIVEIKEEEYKEFLKKFDDVLFFQSVEWAKFKSKTGWNMSIVGLKDNNEIKAATTLLYRRIPVINRRIYYAPRGFTLDFNDFDLIKEFTVEIKKYLKKNKGIILKINPYVEYVKRDKDGNEIGKRNDDLIKLLKELGYKHYGFYINQDDKKDLEPRWISVLDIDNKDMDAVLKEFRQSTRRKINKAKKNCIDILVADFNDLKIYKEIMNHTAERREFEDRALSYYETMFNTIDKDMLRILIASIDLESLKKELNDELNNLLDSINNIKDNDKKKNQLLELEKQRESIKNKELEIDELIKKYGSKPYISTALFLTYQNQTVYLFGGTYKDFMHFESQYLIQCEMINYAINKGMNKYNFYGIDGNFNEDSKNYGLFDYKRGFNADVVELIGEFDLIIGKFSYKLYNIMLSMYGKLRNLKNKIKK